jgi:hypothetical protein
VLSMRAAGPIPCYPVCRAGSRRRARPSKVTPPRVVVDLATARIRKIVQKRLPSHMPPAQTCPRSAKPRASDNLPHRLINRSSARKGGAWGRWRCLSSKEPSSGTGGVIPEE